MTDDPAPRPELDLSVPSLARHRVEVLPECPSTNAYLAARAREGGTPGMVVVAEHQTAGRGRLDRAWVTPARAALTFSVLLRPYGVPVERWSWLPLLAGLAVLDGVRAVTGLEPDLKWPNDVLVDGSKVAGILLERVEAPAGPVAVVGIGVNVSATRAELPVPGATSLLLAGAAGTDRSALLGAVLAGLEDAYDAWRAAEGRPGALLATYRRACSTLGLRVRVALPAGEHLEGTAVDLDDRGRLLVDDGSRVHVLGAGDVVHVRPAVGPG